MDLLYKFRLPAPQNTNQFINNNRKNYYQANNIKNKLKKKIKSVVENSSYNIEIIENPFLLVFVVNAKLRVNSDVDNITLTKDLVDSLKDIIIKDDSIEYMPIAPVVLVNKIHLNEYDDSYCDLYIYDISSLDFKSYYKTNSKGDTVKISGKQRKQTETNNDLIRNTFNLKILQLISDL